MKVAPYTLMNGYLYKLGHDDILWWCALEHEQRSIIEETHPVPARGHFHADTIARK